MSESSEIYRQISSASGPKVRDEVRPKHLGAPHLGCWKVHQHWPLAACEHQIKRVYLETLPLYSLAILSESHPWNLVWTSHRPNFQHSFQGLSSFLFWCNWTIQPWSAFIQTNLVGHWKIIPIFWFVIFLISFQPDKLILIFFIPAGNHPKTCKCRGGK